MMSYINNTMKFEQLKLLSEQSLLWLLHQTHHYSLKEVQYIPYSSFKEVQYILYSLSLVSPDFT